MALENPDVQSFIESYDLDTPVVLDTVDPLTLGQALQFEQLFCSANTKNRLDPVKRLGYLARMLSAAGYLRPEHQHLLEEIE